MSRLDVAISTWKGEVEEETIKLIEAGFPPYDASERAVIIVSQRRKRKMEE